MCVVVRKMLFDVEFDVVASPRLMFMEVTKEIGVELCASGVRRVGKMSEFEADSELFGCVCRSL